MAGVLGAVAVLAMATCDTGDGRELQAPTSDQRADQPTTTTTTTAPPALPPDAGQGASTVAPATAAESAPRVTLPPDGTLPPPSTTERSAFALVLPWGEGEAIATRFTCDDENRSPTMQWTAPPPGSVEMALVVTDDDADDYVHFAAAGIPAMAGEVGEGGEITNSVLGVNDTGDMGWAGPCPPADDGPHTYRFTLYALSAPSAMADGFTVDELLPAIATAVLGTAEATGSYQRAG